MTKNAYSLAKKIDTKNILNEKYSPLLAQLLYNKNLYDLDSAENFINPKYDNNYDPFLLHNAKKTIERIYAAVTNNEKITIYADYDADGVPGAVILKTLFDKIGYTNCDIYIPHRHKEGYGIHIPSLKKIKESGTSLIITIDVGITAQEAGNWCTKNNIDLIITDHHLPLSNEHGNEQLPPSYTIVNPKQSACHYPDPMLCGCGVIFKIIQAFVTAYGKEYNIHVGWEKWLLDLVGISTISDLVPLQNENRIFAKFGMQVIAKTKRPGLKKLLWDAGINVQYMQADDIAFNVTPKINAASRMSHPMDAVEVLCATNPTQSEKSVKHLVKLNNERKKITKNTIKEAQEIINKRDTLTEIIVVGNPEWQIGIVGLVASKLVEQYKRPVFVWSEENGKIKGSCRTWSNYHLVKIMEALPAEAIESFGGHKEAAGFACNQTQIENLEVALVAAAQSLPQEDNSRVDQTTIDTELTVDDINIATFTEINRLGPFGIGNEKPLFIWKNITPHYVEQFGKTKEHIEIHFNNSANKNIRAIAFFKTADEYTYPPAAEESCCLVGHLEHSVFMGRHETRIHIVDIVKDL